MVEALTNWLLTRICRHLAKQGHSHQRNIIAYFSVMRRVARIEFNEDSNASVDAFLYECFQKALTSSGKDGNDILVH